MKGTARIRDVCIPEDEPDKIEYLKFFYEMEGGLQRDYNFMNFGAAQPDYITVSEIIVRKSIFIIYP